MSAATAASAGQNDYFADGSDLYPSRTAPFGDAMVSLARRRPEVVALTADLTKWTDLTAFGETFPERFLQLGMAEQNLIGVAGGLAKGGLLPFAVTYGVFAARRAYDQIAMALATGPSRAVVVGHLPGITSRFPGTHQAIDDIALMRALPGVTVIDPADATEIEACVAAAADLDGLVYLRSRRGKVSQVFDPATFAFDGGRARLVREGSDVAFIGTGLGTVWALEAAAVLAERGVQASVLHVATLKPADVTGIGEFCAGRELVSTVENHSVVGGLADIVGAAIAREGLGTRLVSQGVQDVWGAYGTVPAVRRALGLDAVSIAERALQARDGR